MQLSNYSFENLPFSSLFQSYVADFSKVEDFFEINPFDEQAIAKKINTFEFAGDRAKTIEALTSLNKRFDLHEAALENIERLASKDALVVVTGQQLGIYGGPLYTIFKTLSTIHLANKLEQKYDRPVIPVFWLADEDHDYDEVRGITILDNDEVESFSLPPKTNHLSTVAEMRLTSEIESISSSLKENLFDTDFSDKLWSVLDTTFAPGNTFFDAFGKFISRMFSKHGLILAGSNDPDVKEITKPFLRKSVLKANEIRNTLEKQSERLEQNYHQQVTLYDSNLFYLDDDSGRTKISRNGDGWKADAGLEWNTDQLVQEIETNPERFSPNVFLRPILQDVLLPTIGYVAGPGETAYYGQMRGMYKSFDLTMPIIFPRLSATLIEPAINRIMQELPFEFHEYGNRIEDLESDYVEKTDQHDIEAIFSNWLDKVHGLTNEKKGVIADIDPTLEAATEKATAIYENEINKLKGKVYRSVKQQEKTQLQRIRRIKANTFPQNGLQERTIAAIYYMNKYGVDIWDKLLNSLEKDDRFDHHKLVYL